jgi:hypothetical protein
VVTAGAGFGLCDTPASHTEPKVGKWPPLVKKDIPNPAREEKKKDKSLVFVAVRASSLGANSDREGLFVG